MSARWRVPLCLIGLVALPAAARADGLMVPGLGPSEPYPRPGYREAVYPPPQYGLLGQPLPPTGVLPRPTYRQSENRFPPPGGRYGGGFVEYVMTGGRPEPIAPQYAGGRVPSVLDPGYALTHTAISTAPGAYAGPAYGAPVYAPSPLRDRLPRSGLPDYAPQPTAYYGAAPAAYPQGAGVPFASAAPVTYAAPGAAYDPVAADPGLVTRPMNPVFQRQLVGYGGREGAGTIIIDTPNKFLYLIEGGGRAIRYGIGVGRPGFAWSGVKRISRKAEWPDWTPPREMLARRPDLPRHMDGGIANPLGARALYLGSSLYRIHGTNEPYTIGTNVSSGCIRMMNEDVVDLYGRVGVGTRVIVE